MSIDGKEQLFHLNMHSQRIIRLFFIQNNLIISSEKEMRIVDLGGADLSHYVIDNNNGTILNAELDSEHLFLMTSSKQLILYDILQMKRIGNFFNDFTFNAKDKLPDEKGLSCLTVGNDGLFIAVGGVNGNVYILRS